MWYEPGATLRDCNPAWIAAFDLQWKTGWSNQAKSCGPPDIFEAKDYKPAAGFGLLTF
jgi:hypothetical protein